jgi:hypothetical protein
MVKDCLVSGVTTSIIGNQVSLSGLEIVGFARPLNTSASQQPPVMTEPPLSRETQQELKEEELRHVETRKGSEKR